MVPESLRPLVVFVLVSNLYGSAIVATLAVRANTHPLPTPFSLRKYYALMGWAPLTFLCLGLLVSPRYLAFFFLAGVAGIIGEVLVSLLWRSYFGEPIWVYSYGAKVRGDTSTLNFLPWAVGALLFHLTSKLLGSQVGLAQLHKPMLVATVAVFVGVFVGFPLRRLTAASKRQFSAGGFLVFCLPIATTALALGILCGPWWPAAMAAFAVVGFYTEYSYGRSMSLFFARGLWTYQRWRIDEGHSSFVTFPLWALGGLYFYFVTATLGV
jgi:hypothetical protein